MDTKAILGVVPTMQSAALAASAYKGMRMKKRKGVKRMTSSAVKIMVGAPMIQATSQVIGTM